MAKGPYSPDMLSSLAWLLVTVFVAYLGITAVLFAFQRSLLYHPAQDVETPAGMGVPEMEPVHLRTADGFDLVAWYAPPQRDDGLVIAYFHGNAGTIARRAFKARIHLDAGHGVLLVEYRGYGGNPGRPTEHGLYEDARAGLRWLMARGIGPDHIVLYGESLGTGVAVQMAVETPEAAALVLEAPYTTIPDTAAVHYPLMPVQWLLRDRFDSLSKIAGVASPVLVVHGRRDRVVPFSLGERLYQAAPEPKRALFLPQANHADLYEWGAGVSIVEFLATLKVRATHPLPH